MIISVILSVFAVSAFVVGCLVLRAPKREDFVIEIQRPQLSPQQVSARCCLRRDQMDADFETLCRFFHVDPTDTKDVINTSIYTHVYFGEPATFAALEKHVERQLKRC